MADDDFDDDDTPERDAPPKPKLSTLNLVLILLNWVMAGVFFTMLFLNYQKRQEWSYYIFRNHLLVWGLPLAEEEDNPSVYQVSRPRVRLSGEQIKEAIRDSARNVTPKGEFVTIDEPLPFLIRPSLMTAEVQKDVFKSVGEPVGTLEAEMKRLATAVPAAIDKATEEVLEKLTKQPEDAKRAAVASILLPLSWNVYAVKTVDQKAKAAKGPELDALLKDALQRRMYTDILAPVNIFQPGDLDKFTVEKVSNFETYKIDALKSLLEARLNNATAANLNGEVYLGKDMEGKEQGTAEKRHSAGFLLFAIAQARVPFEDRYVIDKGMERTQLVLGVHQFAIAALAYSRSFKALEDRIVAAISEDREGYLIAAKNANDAMIRTDGFLDKHRAELLRLRDITNDLKHAADRTVEIEKQRKEFQATYDTRVKQLAEATDKLVKARANTAREAETLRQMQQELFRAQVELADAAERNFRLEETIRAIEAGKGAK
jgi:hypothetical protein